jgi:hypothetical protein
VARDRDDDLFDTGTLQFEFGSDPRGEPMSETVELSRSALRAPEPPPPVPARRFALLAFLAVALGAAAFAVVDAVRSDGPAPAATAEPAAPQTVAPATAAGSAESAPATTAASPAAEPPLVPVALDAEGEDVRRLQEALAGLGFGPTVADGIYGQETVAAVAAFQRSLGLVEDGVAGPETIAALNDALGRS